MSGSISAGPTAGGDYGWLKTERAFKMRVLEPGFTASEIVPVGEQLYDPQFIFCPNQDWLEPDGSIILGDIGGQEALGWDATKGHGAIIKLRPDNSLEFLVRPGDMGTYMPLCPIRIPPEFGAYERQVMLVGQAGPGRTGARNQHYVFKYKQGDHRMEVFAELPHAGPLNDGIPGAGLTGGFGPFGSPQEGKFFCMSMMNCTIYTVDNKGRIEPWTTLAPPDVPAPMMPLDFQVAPPWWGEYAGEYIVLGKMGGTYMDEVGDLAEKPKWLHYHCDRKGRVDPTPIPADKVPGSIEAVRAPESFGAFAGDLFWVDEGGVDLNHVTTWDEPVPYRGKVMRLDKQGQQHVFADNFQGSSTLLAFRGKELLMSVMGKSYSTGEYHHPDGSVYAIACAD
jgi:hypothetical protein